LIFAFIAPPAFGFKAKASVRIVTASFTGFDSVTISFFD
jgi:hypothetical protein